MYIIRSYGNAMNAGLFFVQKIFLTPVLKIQREIFSQENLGGESSFTGIY
jgi:hypothetical protein